MTRYIILNFFILFLINVNIDARAEFVFKSIEVQGNNRISTNTIKDIINFRTNNEYTTQNLDEFQKLLFETDFFKNISISVLKENLNIKVEENPLVNFFFIEGIKNKEREDYIYDNLSLGQNKIFSDQLLKKDMEKIKTAFESAGYFEIKIIPKITEIDGNLVNVVLDIDRGKNYNINRILFIGNKHFRSSLLKNVVSSSEYGWWKFLSSNSTINNLRIDYDKNLLKNFYLNEGFFDVQIISTDININSDDTANLTFSINSGNKYNVSKFEIIDEGNNLIPDIKKNFSLLIKNKIIGRPYSQKLLVELRNKFESILSIKKIDFLNLDIKPSKIDDKNINITFAFTKTKRNFIDFIKVKGNSITEEEVIRRELVFSEGDAFTKDKLTKSIRNLKSKQIFKDIKSNVNEKKDSLIELTIEVEEQPTGSVSAGIGAGSSGATIGTSIQETNLFGKGIKSNINLNLGTEKVLGVIDLQIPDFFNSGNEFGYIFSAVSTDFENSGYENSKVGNAVSIKYDIYEDLALSYGFGIDLDKIDTSNSASELYKSREGNYLTSKVFYNLGIDKRDRFISPTKGYKTSFGQTLSLPSSDVVFLGNNFNSSYYHALNEDFVLGLKGGVSTINSLNDKDVKLSDRKFLSNNQIRGFETYGIGPIDGSDHIGGNYSFFSSISSTIPNGLPEKWNANSSLFIDVGNVWGVDFDSSLDSNKIRSTTGIAVDWISPLGPLSFVFSEVITSDTNDVEESFSFQIGSTF
jgi:outer membrane protein insertion porin family